MCRLSSVFRSHNKFFARLAIALGLLGVVCASQARDLTQTVGWIENVLISTKKMRFLAKIDTGADFNSINAPEHKLYQKNGKPWVKFRLMNGFGQSTWLHREVVRIARIKTKMPGYQRRPVVALKVCLGKQAKMAQFNLANRSHFKYQVLIGRNLLKHDYLVSSNGKFKSEPNCKDAVAAVEPSAKN